MHIAGAYIVSDGEVTVSGASTEEMQLTHEPPFLEDTVWNSGETYSFAYDNVDGRTGCYRSLERVVALDGLE